MKTIETTLKTTAIYSDDGKKRYLLRKVWDETKPKAAIIMLNPAEADGIALDSTTMLVLNNASRLGFGAISILNLFAEFADDPLKAGTTGDEENLKAIVAEAKEADTVIYAPGVGRASNQAFQIRAGQVLLALKGSESKLYCITTPDGSNKYLHPLYPGVRTWTLKHMTTAEVFPGAPAAAKETTVKKPIRKKTTV